jgi:hypothetical protein
VIVALYQEGTHVWDAALHRLLAVIAGCLCGLVVTGLFHRVLKVHVEDDGTGSAEREA